MYLESCPCLGDWILIYGFCVYFMEQIQQKCTDATMYKVMNHETST